MSIDISWEALTSGSDGAALAETIRDFIHERFQQVALPRFIRSVQVHSFDLGTVAPDLELKDVCDPLPDFYEDDEDSAEDEDETANKEAAAQSTVSGKIASQSSSTSQNHMRSLPDVPLPLRDPTSRFPARKAALEGRYPQLETPAALFSRTSTPGIPGGTSNLSYFHLPLSAGLSGATTPLAAVAGSHFNARFHRGFGSFSNGSGSPVDNILTSVPSLSPSTAYAAASPRTEYDGFTREPIIPPSPPGDAASSPSGESVNDVQLVARLKYAGDIKLSLTADILLDYPSPSFVGIPMKLNVTGLTFDGVALIAYIKHKAHFCFLSPEDADALVGREELEPEDRKDHSDQLSSDRAGKPVGGLFEEIKVESEIGQREQGKQVLKNVGKVEKFVLEQVRRIFESEFVYPSFWTFLV